MKLRNLFLGGVFALAMPLVSVAETANLDQLLNLVKEGQARDNAEFEQRIAEFQGSKAKQEQLVRDAMAERDRLEALSADKEEQFRDNELVVAEKQAQLNDRLGSLKELFGVLQQVAGDTKSVFEG
ncbi:MAG TPA: energy transducer TonB, partial [Oceanospirillales bacterium]|nr:energy transducer TonB [Oceanospirillales bacterium]